MQITRLSIDNFRGVKGATILFNGHTLLIGANNIGKSTVCEAIDLVLGPDRLSRFPPVEEFDFYNSEYLDETENPKPLRVEVVLTSLSAEVQNACGGHLEFWHKQEKRLLAKGEIPLATPEISEPCLRLETIGKYNPEEDEFEAQTFFSHGKTADDSLEPVSKRIKRMIGFIYLRTLRTGSRALSLERNSLLDIILRIQGVKTGLWERAIKRLRDLDPPIGSDAEELKPVLENIEERLSKYIPLNAPGDATGLYVSQLTREHLRKTLSFFLSTNADQNPVPFQSSGTGTLNTLVLALLSFIADAKPENVIFAMEEPEIALPPHTQRRIANYLLKDTAQCLVSSHSPYVIEQFNPEQIHILKRDNGNLTSSPLKLALLKPKLYKRHARKGLAEAILGKATILVEGITEYSALQAAASKLENNDPTLWPLDLAGISMFSGDGDGDLPQYGSFLKANDIQVYAFFDQLSGLTPAQVTAYEANFDISGQTNYSAIEKLLVAEVPADRQWEFLDSLRTSGQQGNLGIPATRPTAEALGTLMYNALKSNKGNGYAGELIELCSVPELPATITTFLRQIYQRFPRPTRPPILQPVTTAPTAAAATAPVAAATAAVAAVAIPPPPPTPGGLEE